MQHNIVDTQDMRWNAAKPGQGRERRRGQFAGYIPANRAEKFCEAATMMSEAPGVCGNFCGFSAKVGMGTAVPAFY